MTERRAIENYFPDKAVKAAFGNSFSELGRFDLLKDAANPWRKSDNWKIARQIQKEDLAGTDLMVFLERI